MWICGAALGSEGYVKAKLKAVQDRLCGQGDSEGALLTVATELADADPHAAHSAILYSLQARVDYLLGTHLPEQTCELAEAVDATLRKYASATSPASERAFSTRKASADPASRKIPRSSETSSA